MSFKLMPTEATPEMIEAGRWSEYGEESSRLTPVDDESVAAVWAAMAAVAGDESFVNIPRSKEEAEAMIKVASLWLHEHARERANAG